MKKLVIALVCALALSVFANIDNVANATNLAVVNVNEILSDSNPAKAGQEHLQKVQDILKGGMNQVLEMYKGKEETTEAKQVIADAYNKLNQQMAVEQQAVRNVLGNLLTESVKEWRASNKKYEAVLNSAMFLDYNDKLDVTAAILKIYNTKTPVFPELPTVTVNKPEEEPKKK